MASFASVVVSLLSPIPVTIVIQGCVFSSCLKQGDHNCFDYKLKWNEDDDTAKQVIAFFKSGNLD